MLCAAYRTAGVVRLSPVIGEPQPMRLYAAYATSTSQSEQDNSKRDRPNRPSHGPCQHLCNML
jgi:hypothetical protein